MKRIFFIFCFIIPLLSHAQSVKLLIHQADSLNALSKHKKALKLYDRAIARITSYQEVVNQGEWFRLSTAAADIAGKNYMKYSPSRYFAGGEKFNEKIAALKQHGSNCIFTYNSFNTGVGNSYIIDPARKFQFLPSGDQKLLIWLAKDNLYMQAFGDNIFKPLKVENPQLFAFLQANHDKLPPEEIERQRIRYTDGLIFIFNFYWGNKSYKKEIDTPDQLKDPKQNENTYLGKLLPLVQAEAKNYYARLKFE